MNNEYIKIPRDILTWNKNAALVFIFLLANSTNNDTEKAGNSAKNGEWIGTIKSIADGTNLSRQNVRSALKKLEEANQLLTNQSTNVKRSITICNYDRYKDEKNATNQPTNQRSTNDEKCQPTTNQLKTDEINCDTVCCEDEKETANQLLTNAPKAEENFDCDTSNNSARIIDSSYIYRFSYTQKHIPNNPKEKENRDLTSKSLQTKRNIPSLFALSPAPPPAPHRPEVWPQVVAKYNQIATCLPRAVKITETRKNKIRARQLEMEEAGVKWEDVFSKMIESDFLCGRTESRFKANLDWIIANESNWVKVIEGNYDNRKKTVERVKMASAEYRQDENTYFEQF
jgi:hypothetical protein